MLSDMSYFSLISLLSIILLYFNNNYNKNQRSIQAINFLFLSESFVLTFFFEKFPALFSLMISASSIYFIVLQNKNDNSPFTFANESLFPQNILFLFKPVGFFLILCVFIYEYFADGIFSESDILVIGLSFSLISYESIPSHYRNERDFFVVFLFLLSVFFVLPMLLYKLKYGYVGTKSEGFWYDSEFLTYYLLSKPLFHFLSLLGFNLAIDGSFISFEDLVYGRFQTVHIAESCAGISSIKILIASLVSYLLVEYRKLDLHFFVIVLTGTIVSYFANLLRMSIIIISGHYMGIEIMLFVHEYVGWLIFTIWVFIFWILIDKYYIK